MTQDINITEARELFANTTQGKWERYSFNNAIKVSSGRRTITVCRGVNVGMSEMQHNSVFIAYAHNHWQSMLDTIERQAKEIERLKAFEKCVTNAMQWEPETCKAVVESARVELRIKRGEIID